jgi:hypothetical protein
MKRVWELSGELYMDQEVLPLTNQDEEKRQEEEKEEEEERVVDLAAMLNENFKYIFSFFSSFHARQLYLLWLNVIFIVAEYQKVSSQSLKFPFQKSIASSI